MRPLARRLGYCDRCGEMIEPWLASGMMPNECEACHTIALIERSAERQRHKEFAASVSRTTRATKLLAVRGIVPKDGRHTNAAWRYVWEQTK